MKGIGTLGFILFAAANAPAAFAQEPSVDWKYYGGVKLDDVAYCFYDAKGIRQEPDGHIRVWTKCLLQKEMDGIDIKKEFDGKIMQSAAQKIAQYYMPPIALVETIDANQAMAITLYEETADISYIQPRSRIFYELNCHDEMLRELSIEIQTKGKSISHDKPNDWKYVPPEGNGAALLKLLCLAR